MCMILNKKEKNMNQVKPVTETVVVTAPTLQQQAAAIEQKMHDFPHMRKHLMGELQRIRAEILIKG